MLLKVKDHPGLVRDSRTNAIINIDDKSRNEHKDKVDVQKKLQSLESDMQEIKELLKQLTNREN